MKSLILIVSIALAFYSCKPAQVITNTERFDSVYVIERPIEIMVPGATVRETVNYDSLRNLIQRGIKPEVINRTLIRYDTTNNLQLKILIDELGNLTAICESQDQLIQHLENEIYRYKTEKESNTIIQEKKVVPFWVWIIIGILVLPAFYGIAVLTSRSLL